jgi:phosphate transport system substrate-binding protein
MHSAPRNSNIPFIHFPRFLQTEAVSARTRPSARLAVLAFATIVPLADGAFPQDQAIRDSIEVQKARNQHVQSRGKKVFYTRKFDLGDLPSYKPEQTISGTIRIWGLNYLRDANLADYWAAGFRKYHPDATVEWHLPVAMASTSALVTGVADIGANRGLTFTEILQFERVFNYNPLELDMVTGSFDVPGWANAIGIFVNKANPISKLTMNQLDGIFGAARTGGWVGTSWNPQLARGPGENIRTWGQLGLTGDWADKPIHVYGLNLRYDTSTKFSDKVLKGSDKWNENLIMYANYARSDGSLAIGAELLMQDLSKDPYGIAYSGIQNLTPQTKALALAVNESGPYVEMTMDSVWQRTWPLYQRETWVLNRKPGTQLEPKVREFMRYVFSREGQQEVVRDGKFLPLTGAIVSEQLKKLE